MNFNDTEIADAYDKVPFEEQGIIWSPETTRLVGGIVSRYNIPQDKAGLIGDEVLYMLIGLTKKAELPARISALLQMPEKQSEQLAQELISGLLRQKNNPVPQSAKAPAATQSQEPVSASRTIPDDVGVPVQTANHVAESVGSEEVPTPVETSAPAPESVPKANPHVREKLELRPEEVPAQPMAGQVEEESSPKPLTREDVLNALASKRTMASDIDLVKKSRVEPEE